jgi:soluble lytic murein transglycosylase-like protein
MRRTNRIASMSLSLLLTTVSCSVYPAVDSRPTAGRSAEAEADATRVETVRIAEALHSWETGLRPAEVDHLASVIVGEARLAELPPMLVLAVIEVESGGRNFAVSPVGARGLMQLLPTTGAFVAAAVDLPWQGPDTLFDPAANVKLGVRYLQQLLERYPDLRTALAAYNWGPGHISQRLRRGEPLPRQYADRVLSAWSGSGREI